MIAAELAKNPEHGLSSAIKPVRRAIKDMQTAAESATPKRSVNEDLVEQHKKGPLPRPAVSPLVLTWATVLETAGILRSTEWLLARDVLQWRGLVGEWIARTRRRQPSPAQKGPAQERQVHRLLFEDLR